MFTSISINNFRCFEDFSIESLDQFILYLAIVGCLTISWLASFAEKNDSAGIQLKKNKLSEQYA